MPSQQELMAAYAATRFEAEVPDGLIVLRIGQLSDALGRLCARGIATISECCRVPSLRGIRTGSDRPVAGRAQCARAGHLGGRSLHAWATVRSGGDRDRLGRCRAAFEMADVSARTTTSLSGSPANSHGIQVGCYRGSV